MKFSHLVLYLVVIFCVFDAEKIYAQKETNNTADEFFLEKLFAELSSSQSDTAKLRLYGEIYHSHYNLDTIIKYAKLADSVAQKLADEVSQAEALMFIGAVYNAANENLAAEEFFRRSLAIWQRRGDVTKQAVCYNCIAVILENRNIYGEAIDNYSKALELFINSDDSLRVSRIYRGLSNTYNGFAMFSAAKDYAEKALDIDLKTGDNTSVAFDYVYLGNAYCTKFEQSGEKDTAAVFMAVDFYLKGFEAAEKSNFLEIVVDAGLELQKVYLKIAKFSSGQDFQNALENSRLYGRLTKSSIDKMNAYRSVYLFDINCSREDILLKKYAEAKKILDKYSALFLSDMKLHEKFYYEDLGDVLKYYYKELGMFKELLLFNSEYDRYRIEKYKISYAVTGHINSIKITNSRIVSGLDEKITENDIRYRHFVTKSIFITLTLLIVTTVGILIVVRLRKDYWENCRLSEILTAQKADIEHVNEELNRINETVKSQLAEINAQRLEISLRKDEILAANEAVIRSIEYAGDIQRAAMPSKSGIEKIFGDFLLIFNPLEIVSGDFFWAAKIGNMKLAGVFDCTGHGIPGGLLSMFVISTLNDILPHLEASNVAAGVLNGLRRKFLSATSEDNYDGTDAAVIAVDTEKNELHCAGAMRPIWIFRDSSLIEILPERVSIGRGKYQGRSFTEKIVKFQKNDCVYLFTDGMTDVFGGLNEAENVEKKLLKFSLKRMKKLLTGIYNLPFEQQQQIICGTLDEWQAGFCHDTKVDDQLMLGFRL